MYDQPQPNYTTQPNYAAPGHIVPDRGHVDWRLAGAYIVAALAIGIACASLWLLRSNKLDFQAQMTQMHHTLTTAQTAQTKNARNIADMSGRLSSAEAQLVLVSPYSMVCQQYLTGPSGGPETFSFPCTDKKVGS
jgi:uncharacterized protein HemX